MIYRKLPHGNEKTSILGLGANGLAENGDPGEILMKGKRYQVYLQVHFGADYTQCKSYRPCGFRPLLRNSW